MESEDKQEEQEALMVDFMADVDERLTKIEQFLNIE